METQVATVFCQRLKRCSSTHKDLNVGPGTHFKAERPEPFGNQEVFRNTRVAPFRLREDRKTPRKLAGRVCE